MPRARAHLDAIREQAALCEAAGTKLRALPQERVVHAVVGAIGALLDPDNEAGQRARSLLLTTSGLSREMIDWGLATSGSGLTPSALECIFKHFASRHAEHLAVAPRLTAIVLAGNVFTAGLRPILFALLARSPILVKASSDDAAFPTALADAIGAAEPAFAEAVRVVSYPGGDPERDRALFERADVIEVFGSDATVADVRSRMPFSARLVAHGHGLGVIYIPTSALGSESALSDAARRIAADVAAYDQRGCFSPHVVWVQDPSGHAARELARATAFSGLAELAKTRPRGPLAPGVASQQLQWRGVAMARGELFEGDGYATSFEGANGFRPSPGWRNLCFVSCQKEAEFMTHASHLGVHLKAIGVAEDANARRALARSLAPPLAPRVCRIGAMQEPAWNSVQDGVLAESGLLRWTVTE